MTTTSADRQAAPRSLSLVALLVAGLLCLPLAYVTYQALPVAQVPLARLGELREPTMELIEAVGLR